jgi:broad specificity phosphatase PhoE
MSSKIHVIRHAEAVHNLSKDFSKFDPPLTPLGFSQAANLIKTFPDASNVGLILTSPLKRAIQTTLSAFPHVLDKRYFDPESASGIERGAELVIDAELQERSSLPCDTGSDIEELRSMFPRLDFGALERRWQWKEGLFAPDDEAVRGRAVRVRKRLEGVVEGLKGREKRDVVVVTHGVFMRFLVGDEAIDLPKAGWRSYGVGSEGGGVVLVPVREM